MREVARTSFLWGLVVGAGLAAVMSYGIPSAFIAACRAANSVDRCAIEWDAWGAVRYFPIDPDTVRALATKSDERAAE